ncbi:aldo/keto reductase [Edaphobacter acidisoli]|uniref:Aldo/keto reductase n=1 Tax=Edaphobacter acidisoli TaxID=2040573 RepID=A0A916REE4_9BACT|nr:aldo/keto reductase [Edaphobacter acidisoli]GGA53505.1 aldo/keto reductase [Edaphobacter acidisoli]
MEYRTLQGTDLNVSRLCFGTMTFGAQADASAARDMVARSIEAGINFFDTANIYQAGAAETMLGDALKRRRQSVVVATKVWGKMGDAPEQSGLSKKAIVRAIEESLRRLQTDYVDLYYFHQPDYDVPVEESLEAMDALVEQGKVRFPATSNYSSWQVAQMLSLAEKHRYRPVSVAQHMYNLLARGIEQEFLPMAKEMGVSVIAYNPLAAGLLTGKHTRDAVAAGTRFDGNKMYQDRYWHAEDFDAVDQLKQVGQSERRSLLSVALGWMLHHTPIDSIILGASRLEQLDQNIATAGDGPLSSDAVERCNEAWRTLRGPTPQYNR